ncbi:Uncharacterised protein [Agrobacterium tumefaciens]|nr:Uncharacterised protein [Agrobacterium tumefaciens]
MICAMAEFRIGIAQHRSNDCGGEGQPDSLLLRGAGHSARLPKRSNPQRAILTFRGLRADVYFSDPLPAEDVKVLRRLELFLLTPLRILAGTIVFWIVNNLVVFLTAGAGLTFVFNILWYTIVILYVIYVALQAIVPIIASGGPGFDDALRVRRGLGTFADNWSHSPVFRGCHANRAEFLENPVIPICSGASRYDVFRGRPARRSQFLGRCGSWMNSKGEATGKTDKRARSQHGQKTSFEAEDRDDGWPRLPIWRQDTTSRPFGTAGVRASSRARCGQAAPAVADA